MAEKLTPKQEKKTPLKLTFDEGSQDVVQRGFLGKLMDSNVFSRLGLRQRKCVPRTLQPQVIWEIGNILGGMKGEFDPETKLVQRLHRLFPDKFPTPRLPYGEIISGRRG